ncbi:TnpV protein [Thomasclavelia saccharogumia]|uniref:TnpV protein n=1 Tax=Thomasclavelia saccharogumia TaxID=341225 RepID=UPI000479E1BA|nr:TnpV protein [Thomasclavelia saccharogumia]
MKIEYEEINGLLYPKLTLPPQNEIHLTRFGRKRLQYLKQHRPIVYTNLLISGELNDHLQMVDDEANALYDKLIEEYKTKRNITEDLKEKDQMKWVQEMNNIQNCVEEIINRKIIYM